MRAHGSSPAKEPGAQRRSFRLIQAAKASNSNDNITCLVLRAVEPSWSDRMLGRLKPGRSKTLESI